jgi:hypothetical protein
MGDGLQVLWNRRQRVPLRKQGMLVMDVYEGYLTLDVNSCSEY